jgi:hypothetical protein
MAWHISPSRSLPDHDQTQTGGVLPASAQADEGLHQARVILDLGHAADAADHAAGTGEKLGTAEMHAFAHAGMEAFLVDAVVYLGDPRLGNADGVPQPAGQIAADGDVMVDHLSGRLAQEVVLTVPAFQIEHVSAMLAVHSPRYTRERTYELGLQRTQISGVQNVWAQRAQQAKKP